MLKDHRGVKLHAECLEAVQRAAKRASLGHVFEEADPKLDLVALRPMIPGSRRQILPDHATCAGRRWDASPTPVTWRL